MQNKLRSAVAWAWRWRWSLLMNAFLVSPIAVYQLRVHEPGPRKMLLFTFTASILWLLVVQLPVRRVWLVHALMFPLYVCVTGDLFVIANYETRLGSNMILTVVENASDALDFIQSDFKRVIGSLGAMLLGYAVCLWKVRPLRVETTRAAALVPLAAVGILYGVAKHYGGDWNTVLLNDLNSPFGVFSQSYLTRSLYEQEMRQRARSKSFRFGAKRDSVPDEMETYLLVIGESSRKHDWSLYGYPRETNPRLSKLSDLIVFRDVITQVAQTQVSVPLIVSRGSADDRGRVASERSILSLFHEIGFRTYWLSTQQRETSMAAISRYASEADGVRFLEHRHDIVLVDAIREWLNGKLGQEKKLFFVVHTLGSHFNLTSRYPREFAKFDDGQAAGLVPGTSAWVSRAELINAYDNTILYTDYVLAELIDVVQKRPGIKSVLFVPDHGDNLRDDDRNLFGHAHNNEYDLPIPMLFWYSPEYAKRFPDKVAAAQANASRPINTRSVFYSLTDMAGARIDDPELSALSVFGRGLVNVKRSVIGQGKVFDFDAWMARTNTKIPQAVPPK